jgi:DNA-binding MarR family transcriptional regulator
MSDDGRPAGDDTLGGLVGYHLRRAQLRAFAAFAAAVRDDALTPMLFGVMAVIRDRGDLHQSDIAAALGADRSTMVRLVDQLQKRGLAVRVTSSSDRRVSVPRLTERGVELLERAAPAIAASEEEFLGSLTSSERATLIALLRRTYADTLGGA